MPSIGIIFEIVSWNFESASDVYKCDSFPINKLIKILNNAVIVKLHCNYTLDYIKIVLTTAVICDC